MIKESRILYFLLLLLLVIGFISVKTTLIKMRKLGQEADMYFLKVTEIFDKQRVTLINIERNLADYYPEIIDSLEGIPDPPEIDYSALIDFTIFSENLHYQSALMNKINNTINLIEHFDLDTISNIKLQVDNIEKGTQEIFSKKENYNYLAHQHNTYIKKFPRNFYSVFFHFQAKAYFRNE